MLGRWAEGARPGNLLLQPWGRWAGQAFLITLRPSDLPQTPARPARRRSPGELTRPAPAWSSSRGPRGSCPSGPSTSLDTRGEPRAPTRSESVLAPASGCRTRPCSPLVPRPQPTRHQCTEHLLCAGHGSPGGMRGSPAPPQELLPPRRGRACRPAGAAGVSTQDDTGRGRGRQCLTVPGKSGEASPRRRPFTRASVLCPGCPAGLALTSALVHSSGGTEPGAAGRAGRLAPLRDWERGKEPCPGPRGLHGGPATSQRVRVVTVVRGHEKQALGPWRTVDHVTAVTPFSPGAGGPGGTGSSVRGWTTPSGPRAPASSACRCGSRRSSWR